MPFQTNPIRQAYIGKLEGKQESISHGIATSVTYSFTMRIENTTRFFTFSKFLVGVFHLFACASVFQLSGRSDSQKIQFLLSLFCVQSWTNNHKSDVQNGLTMATQGVLCQGCSYGIGNFSSSVCQCRCFRVDYRMCETKSAQSYLNSHQTSPNTRPNVLLTSRTTSSLLQTLALRESSAHAKECTCNRSDMF